MMTRDEAIKLLRGGQEGIEEWNQRRHDGLQIPNLSGANLADVNLSGFGSGDCEPDVGVMAFIAAGANLIEADLSHAVFANANLDGANLKGANLIGARLNS